MSEAVPAGAFRRAYRPGALILSLASLLLAPACMTIRLVSDHDERTEIGATELQRQLSTFFVGLQSATPEQRRFDFNQPFYRRTVVDLNALQVRASGLSRNSLTQEQLQLVEDNLAYLALLHKGCITAMTPEIRTAIRENGVDTSADCRTDFGASADVPDRGASMLNPVLVGNLQTQFDQALGAVIALELAKRRGEAPQNK
jgi:hypothetical protein